MIHSGKYSSGDFCGVPGEAKPERKGHRYSGPFVKVGVEGRFQAGDEIRSQGTSISHQSPYEATSGMYNGDFLTSQ